MKGQIREMQPGSFGIFLLFFILVAIVLALGLFFVIGSSVINYGMDIVVPEIKNIGELGGANMTEVAGYTLDPLDTTIQAFTWITGISYFVAFFGLFGLAVAYKTTMSRVMIPLFFLMAILMIFASIFISNVYEDIYEDIDDISTIAREHVLLSWLILHQPMILTLVVFLSGIIMFSGIKEGDFV